MIDSHCHLFFDKLRNNLIKIIKQAKKNNITSILSINTKLDEFNDHLNLIKDYNSIYISCGVHPGEINMKNIPKTDDIISFCNNKKVIGIGETGIDCFHSTEYLKSQYKSFENHIEASLITNLPLIIHQRNSEDEIIDILSNYKNSQLSLVMHCFTGSTKLRNFCLDYNYYISLSGIITFKNADKLRAIIKSIPLTSLLVETDSPFLTPEPYRSKINEPAYVYYIGKYLANFFNLDINEFERITNENFYKLFSKAIQYNEISI